MATSPTIWISSVMRKRSTRFLQTSTHSSESATRTVEPSTALSARFGSLVTRTKPACLSLCDGLCGPLEDTSGTTKEQGAGHTTQLMHPRQASVPNEPNRSRPRAEGLETQQARIHMFKFSTPFPTNRNLPWPGGVRHAADCVRAGAGKSPTNLEVL